MREIDLETWPRRDHYEMFRHCHDPWFDICGTVDVTALRAAAADHGIPVTAAIIHALTWAANEIPEFRLRIRGESVVEHEFVHPGTTILGPDDLFGFCYFDYDPDLVRFGVEYVAKTAEAEQSPTLDDPPDRDDLLYMTAIPWVAFTSFSHPIPPLPPDSIPRFAWGRFVEAEGRSEMPLSVQGHHALMDGLHVGRYFERLGEYLKDPAGL
jgi:chloramphenicol O-acetyltransferase type A